MPIQLPIPDCSAFRCEIDRSSHRDRVMWLSQKCCAAVSYRNMHCRRSLWMDNVNNYIMGGVYKCCAFANANFAPSISRMHMCNDLPASSIDHNVAMSVCAPLISSAIDNNYCAAALFSRTRADPSP